MFPGKEILLFLQHGIAFGNHCIVEVSALLTVSSWVRYESKGHYEQWATVQLKGTTQVSGRLLPTLDTNDVMIRTVPRLIFITAVM